MDTKTSSPTLPKQGLGIEDLLRAAFARTKDRLLSYILAYLLAVAIMLAALVVIGVLVGVNVLVWVGTQSIPLTTITSIISVIAALLGLIFVGSWTTLATTSILISPTKIGVSEAYKSVKPYVWQFYWVSLITSLFMIGLLPWGILSIFILMILWSIWGAFTIFVFLDKKEKGLKNVFMSKSIVSTEFWGVLLRIVVVYVGYYLILFILNMAQGRGGGAAALITVITIALNIVAGPFIMSYLYEMYRNLNHPKESGSNTVWKILSAVGWLIMIFALIAGGAAAAKNAPKIIEQMQNNQNQQQMMQQFQEQSSESGLQENMTDEEYQQFEAEMQNLMQELEQTQEDSQNPVQ